jgi:hypothetical protein
MVQMHNIHCCAAAINGCKKMILTDADVVTVVLRQLNKHMWMIKLTDLYINIGNQMI